MIRRNRRLRLVLLSFPALLAFSTPLRAQAWEMCDPIHVLEGEAAGDQFGWIVADGGDVDADGVPDPLVGAPFNDTGGSNAGRAYVFSGASGLLLYRFTGDTPNQRFGHGVSAAGDLDVDGHGEIIVGGFGSGAGVARIYSGVDGAEFTELLGESTGDQFGWAVGGGGDVDGDGTPDLLFGSWRANNPGVPFGGKIRLHSGVDGAEIGRFSGDVAFDQLGYDSAGIGDIDGDSWPDYLASAAPFDNNRGRVYVISGRPAPPRAVCETSPNSVGTGARIGTRRSISLGDNDWRLRATNAVPGQTGIFFYGTQPNSLPFGDGVLCIAGPHLRILPPLLIGAGGLAELAADFAQPPFDTGPGALIAGDDYLFQFWYRDPGAGSFGFNLSDALSVRFCP